MNFNSQKPKLVVVCGPTGTGKTTLAIQLARRFNGEIIGADSMQVYRHMDIGTAKPTMAERKQAVHHLVDVVDPDENFDAALYTRLAREAAAKIHRSGRLPLVVGGTGFYIRALLHGIFPSPPGNPALRERLKHELSEKGPEALHARLASDDPAAAASIHPRDAYRILRALETLAATGQPISHLQQRHAFAENPYEVLKLGLATERDTLYRRIDHRANAMLAAGLLQETEALLAMGYSAELKSMQALGYRHMAAYLRQGLPWEEAVRTLKRDTRRYAKRQLTWFRADPDLIWCDPGAPDEFHKQVQRFAESR